MTFSEFRPCLNILGCQSTYIISPFCANVSRARHAEKNRLVLVFKAGIGMSLVHCDKNFACEV